MMTKKIYQIIAVLLVSSNAFAQVTKIGNDTLLDVAGWNVEWFGDATNGPSNESLQYANVKSVLKNTDIDVWGLAEVSNPTTFVTLLTDLPLFAGVSSSFSQTQKTAMIWKKSKFDLLSSGNVLTESTYGYAFASRPPLEVVLIRKDSIISDTLYFYVVHFKANTGTSADKLESYNRRQNAASFLKTYLDQSRRGKKCFVLGDWNDDLDESIVYDQTAYKASPFLNFINDSNRYFYPSLQLTKSGKQSTIGYNNMIDHQLISAPVKDSFYVMNSSEVLTQVAAQITNYGNSTSDHYPILARYNFKRYLKPVMPATAITELFEESKITVFPNPARQKLTIQSPYTISSVKLINILGEAVLSSNTSSTEVNVEHLSNGLYYLMIVGEQGSVVKRIQVQR